MGPTLRWVLRVTGVLAISAVLTSSCALQGGAASPMAAAGDKGKLKVKVRVDLDKKEPFDELKIDDAIHNLVLAACTQADIDAGKCKRRGYPLKEDKSAEYYGDLSRDPILILTNVASPGTTCVCYGNQCYCR